MPPAPGYHATGFKSVHSSPIQAIFCQRKSGKYHKCDIKSALHLVEIYRVVREQNEETIVQGETTSKLPKNDGPEGNVVNKTDESVRLVE